MLSLKNNLKIRTRAIRSKFKLLFLLSLALLSVVSSPTINALDSSYYMNQNIFLINPDSGCSTDSSSTSSGGSTSASGEIEESEVLEKILRFFTEKVGMTIKQASAIAGNFQQESSLDPMAINDIGAIGIAQWLDRAENLRVFGGVSYPNIPSLEKQLDFVVEELYGSESPARETFVANSESASISQLAVVFGEAYERYSKERGEEGKRGSYAEQIYNLYKDKIPDGEGMKGGSSGSSSIISTSSNEACSSSVLASASSSAIVKVAMDWAWESHVTNPSPTSKYAEEAPIYSSIASSNYTDCTYFVGSVMRKVFNQKAGEKGFPEGDTIAQKDYLLNDTDGKFQVVEGINASNLDQLQPGDIIVTPLGTGGRDNGVANHIAIYGGEELLGSGLTNLEASQGTFAPQRSRRDFLEYQFKSSQTIVIRATGNIQESSTVQT